MKYKIPEYKKSPLSTYCPYIDIVDDSIIEEDEIREFFHNALIQNKDGSIQVTYKFSSPITDNSEDFEVQKVDEMSEALSTLTSRFTIHFDCTYRKPKTWYVNESENMLTLDKEIENKRYQESKEYNTFIPEYYLTINYALKTSKKEKKEEENPIEDFYLLLRPFIALLDNAKFSLSMLRGNDLLTYLHSCLTLKNDKIESEVLSGSYSLDELLCTENFDHLHFPLRLGDKYIAVLSVDKIKQNYTSPNNLSSLFNLGIPLRLVTRCKCYTIEESENIISKRREIFNSKLFDFKKVVAQQISKDSSYEIDPNTREVNNKQQCEDALQALADGNGKVSFGLYTGVLIIEGRSEKEIKDYLRLVQDTLVGLKVIAKVEKINAFSAFISSLPGESHSNPRQFLLSTYNIASYMTLCSLFSGITTNEHLKELTGVGTPHLYGYLVNGSPYCLNLNGSTDDVGHTLIIGNTGAGKSFLLSLLASSWSKYPNSRCIIFDRGFSSLPLVKGDLGKVVIPGKDKVVFNPLRDVKEDKTDALHFLNSIIEVNSSEKTSITPEEREEMEKCLDKTPSLFTNLSSFQKVLMGKNHHHPLSHLLNTYTTGRYGDLFNNTEDHFIDNVNDRLILIELSTLMNMGDKVITPSLVYMFDRLNKLLSDRRPTLLILDECWTFLMNKVFREYLITLLKTMRKNNVFVVMSTQNIKDIQAFDKEGVAESTILSSVHTRIFLPDERANKDEMLSRAYSMLGLSEYHKNILSMMRRKKDYYIMQSEGEALVDFRASSLKKYFTLTDELIKEVNS